MKATEEAAKTDPEVGNSRVRFRALEARLGKSDATPGLAEAKGALRSKDSAKNPVCRVHSGDDDVFTFGSVVMTLSGEPSLEVTAWPPDRNMYRRFGFEPAAAQENRS